MNILSAWDWVEPIVRVGILSRWAFAGKLCLDLRAGLGVVGEFPTLQNILLHISVMWWSWVRGAWRAFSLERLPIQVSMAARGSRNILEDWCFLG